MMLLQHDEYRNPVDGAVLATLDSSFRAIGETSTALDLLALMSFLDDGGIPFSLVENFYKRLEQRARDDGNGELQSLEEGLEQLKSHSLVSDGDDDTFWVPQVVRLSTSAWIGDRPRYQGFRGLCRDALVASWAATGDNSERKQSLLPHIHAAIYFEAVSNKQLRKWVPTIVSAASFAEETYQTWLARSLVRKLMRTFEATHGRDSRLTVDTALWYLQILVLNPDMEAVSFADSLQDRAAIRLGPDYDYTLECQAKIGCAYLRMGELDRAEKLLSQAHETGLRELEADDKVMAELSSCLALLWSRQGHAKKALELYLPVYDVLEKKHGAYNLYLWEGKATLAAIYQALGDYRKAKNFSKEIVHKTEDLLGQDDIGTAEAKKYLAKFYSSMGKFKKAEPLCNEARRVFEKALGFNSPPTIDTLIHLCYIYEETRREDEAAALFKRLEFLIHNSPDLGSSERLQIRSGCTHEMRRKGRYQEAREVMEDCVEYAEIWFGDDHEETCYMKRDLVKIYKKMKLHKEADKLQMEMPPDQRLVSKWAVKCVVM